MYCRQSYITLLMNLSLIFYGLMVTGRRLILIGKVKKQAKGKLIVKEYPTACAGSANFRHLLNELKIKKNFALFQGKIPFPKYFAKSLFHHFTFPFYHTAAQSSVNKMNPIITFFIQTYQSN